eukprot:204069_1
MQRDSDLFRSLPEIKQYLDNLLPNIPPLFALQGLIIRPSIILFNIFFIIYEFYYIVLNNASYVVEKNQKLDEIIIGHKIVAYIEFVGLMLILLFLIYSCIKHYHATSIDLANKMCSWSSFYVFFMFRPTELLNNSSKLYKHYLKSFKYPNVSTNELNKLKNNLQNEFDHQKEIETEMVTKFRNAQVDELINNNSYQETEDIRNHKNKYNDILKQVCYVDHIQHILTGINRLIYENDHLKDEMKKEEQDMAKTMETDHTQHMHQIMIKITSFLASISLCFLGLILFILKLSQFDFVDNTKINKWSTNDWILCLGFANQFWNVMNINQIEINTIYKLLYLNESLKFTNTVLQKISILDGLIKQELCNNYGFKGIILSLNINIKFLLKIMVKDPFVAFHQLYSYNYKLNNEHTIDNYNKMNMDQKEEEEEEEQKYDDEVDNYNRKSSIISVNVDESDAGHYQLLLGNIDETKSQNVTTIIYSSFMELKENVNNKIELQNANTKAAIHPYIDAKKIVVKYTQYKYFDITKHCYLKRSKIEQNNYYSYQLISSDKPIVNLHKEDESIVLFTPNILFNEEKMFNIIEWIITKLLLYCFVVLFVFSGLFSLLVAILEPESSNRCINVWETHFINGICILVGCITWFLCVKKGMMQKKCCDIVHKLIVSLCTVGFVTAQFENAEFIFSSKCEDDLLDIDSHYPVIAIATYSNVILLLSIATTFGLSCIVHIHLLFWMLYLLFVWMAFFWRLVFNILYWIEFVILLNFRKNKLKYNCVDKLYMKLILDAIFWIVVGQLCLFGFVLVIGIPKTVYHFTCKKWNKKCKMCDLCIQNKCGVLSACHYHAKATCYVVVLASIIVLMILNIILFVSISAVENSNDACFNMIHETPLNRLKWIAFSDFIVTIIACWFWIFHKEVAKKLMKELWNELEKNVLFGLGKKSGKNVGKNVAKHIAK